MIEKYKSAILLIISALTLGSFVSQQTLTIRPGISVGQFYLDSTTLGEVKSILGKGKIQKLKWIAPDCGMMYPYYKLIYENRGISFVFYKNDVNKTDRFKNIELFKNSIAETEKQISIGRSIKLDVINKYGLPTNKEFDKLLRYENLGISFLFENSKYEQTDTLTDIYIYKPL